MSEVKKITEEQLNSIKDFNQKSNNILLEIGFLETKKLDLLAAYSDMIKELNTLKADLQKEYGDVNINLLDGTYEDVEKADEEKSRSSKIMDSVVRKISIGSDYKNDAMHYAVGQQVYGGHTISAILHNQDNLTLTVYS